MAREKTATAEKEATTENLPATTGTGVATSEMSGGIDVPDYLRDQVQEDQGKGVSTRAEDNIVPLVYVLQTNSPQVNRRHESYIEGAEPGDIWLRGAPQPIVKGQEGFLCQPCWFDQDIVEWVPRDDGGGFIGRHRSFPKETIKTEDPESPGVFRYSLPNGHELKETRYHVVRVFTKQGLIMPYVIPMTGTGHSVSRQWMFQMTSKLTAQGKPIPSFACLYLVKTKFRKNKKGEFFTLDVHDGGFVKTPRDYQLGKELHESMASGEKKIEEDSVATGEGSSADAPM